MRAALRSCAATMLASVLAGCSLIPHYGRQALPVSENYPGGPAFGGDAPNAVRAASDIDWTVFFTDPALRGLIAFALQNNRDLSIAIDNVESAEASYRFDRAALFPTLDATAGGQFERQPPAASGGFGSLHTNAYSLGLGITSYELDLFGKQRSKDEQARQNFLAEAETREATQISLIAQLAAEYLTWLADRESVDIATRTAADQQRSYGLNQQTLQHGTGTLLDVAQAESALRTAQASEAQYTRQYAQDMDEMVLLAGAPLPPDLLAKMAAPRDLDSTAPFPDLPAGLPADLLARRPDIRSAEHNLLAANANVGAARAAFFPSVTITGNGGTTAGTIGGLFGAGTGAWLFQPQISVPIFDAGANFANLDIVRIQKRIEIAMYEKAIQSAFHDVADALAARTTYASQAQAQQQLVDADQRYYNLSKLRFDNGIDAYLSVLVAENSLFSAQLNLVSVKLAQQQNLITLYKDLGGGWSGGAPGK